MIRISILLLLFAIGRAQAETPVASGFDQDRLTTIYTEALTFIAPRILDPISVPQLTLWGLQGLTALDPNVRVVAKDGHLQLFRQGQMVFDIPTPKDDAPAAWARTAALLTAATFPVSAHIKHAGAQGVIQAFFDQLFSRLDPYSRYVPPVEAGEDRARRAGRAGLGLTILLC